MVADSIIEIMNPAVENHESHWEACVASGEVFVFCDLFQDGIRSIGDDPDILLAAFFFFFLLLFLPLSAAFLCCGQVAKGSSPDTFYILCPFDCSQQSLYDNNSPVGLPMSKFSFPASISCFRMRHAHNTHAPSGTSSKSSMYVYTPGTNRMVLGHNLELKQQISVSLFLLFVFQSPNNWN